MNTKRLLSLVLLGMIIVLPLLTTSCFKKGEEDPFLSIYTRKARVTGEWTITDMKSVIKSTFEETDQILTTTTVTGLDWNQTIEILGAEDSIVEIEGIVVDGRNKIIFYSDGRFVQIWEYEYSTVEELNEGESTFTTIYKVQEEMNGTWNFLNNIDDFKNKERLAIVIMENKSKTSVYTLTVSEEDETIPVPTFLTSYGTSQKYANGEMSTIWTLRMLKNKQIIMEQNVERFQFITDDGIGESITEVGYVEKTLKRD